jgi:sugar/nucleoside kinase (ribokinase family)
MASGRRMGVLGTLVWDRIHHPSGDGEVFEDWGGIAYSLAALSACAPPDWELLPLLKVGSDLAEEALAFLASLDGVVPGNGVVVVPEPNNRVELRYADAAHRCERQSGGVPPWELAELRPHLEGLDALYLNFISGQEIPLGEMKRVRSAFAGPLYADLHSLLLDRPEHGPRRLRALPAWEEWVGCFDAVQLNEEELTAQSGGAEPWGFAAAELAPRALLTLVTRGARGAAYWAAEGLPAAPLDWPAHRSAAVTAPRLRRDVPAAAAVGGDPTGCGDVWGATLWARLLAGEGVEAALGTAHRAAARNAARRGTRGLAEALRGPGEGGSE